jgi:hypothetical protein
MEFDNKWFDYKFIFCILMKIKSESSALGSHYLSSLLPFAEEQPQQITKNREFYKP